MPRCIHHPGRESVANILGQHYCTPCQDGITAARGRVDRHVEPKDCFVWYRASNDWQPITGTGCAHWVAHQLSIRTGSASERCLAGRTYRVRSLIAARIQVPDISQVRLNDIYVTPAVDHTGLVVRLTPATRRGAPPSIRIRHDSSRQGGVAENDFATYFHGRGSFYR